MCSTVGLFPPANDSIEMDYNVSSNYSLLAVSVRDDSSAEVSGYRVAERVMYTYVLPVLCCFGIVGNILNLVILTRKSLTIHMERLEKCAHSHLIALAVSDLMYCITAVPRSAMPTSPLPVSYISGWLLYYTFHGAVINTFLLCSSWLTVAMAVSRYIAICYPVRARQHLGITATRIVIALIFITSVLFNLPRYFIKSIHSFECPGGGYSYFPYPGPLRIQPQAEHIYLWIYFVVGIIIPLIAVAYCNIYFIRALQASKKLRRNSCAYSSTNSTNTSSSSSSSSNAPNILTLTLSIIVVLYILLVIPAELIQFFKTTVDEHFAGNNTVLETYSLASAVCNNLQTLNFAVNFLLYCMINVHFRRVMVNMLCHFRATRPQSVWKISMGERSSMLTTNNTSVMVNL